MEKRPDEYRQTFFFYTNVQNKLEKFHIQISCFLPLKYTSYEIAALLFDSGNASSIQDDNEI